MSPLGTILTFALLAQTPSTQPIKLASPGLSYVGIDEKAGEFYADYFATQLSSQGGFRITTRSEISAVMGFERQKQLLGCSDEATSCLAELAGALGVDGLVVGNLARTQRGSFVATLKVVSASDARAVVAETGRLKDDEALLDWLGEIAKVMAPKLRAAFGRAAPVASVTNLPMPPPPVKAGPRGASSAPAPLATAAQPTMDSTIPEPQSSGMRRFAWIPAAAGGALLVGGGVSYGMAFSTKAKLDSGEGFTTIEEVRGASATGQLQQTIGAALLGVGAAGLAAAGVLFFVGPPAPAQPVLSASPLPGGGAMGIAGVLP